MNAITFTKHSDLCRILNVWTHCYHITYDVNIPSIRQSRSLFPADILFRAADERGFSQRRRTRDIFLRIGRQDIVIRNQRPLDPASLDLGANGIVEDYVACLNSRAYFWPGTVSGPIDDGLRMFHHVGVRRSVVIRVPTDSLIQTNRASMLCVSTCNTGAAWTEGGQKSRRGPEVFEPIERFSGLPAQITEFSFVGPVCLPIYTTYAVSPSGPWRILLST